MLPWLIYLHIIGIFAFLLAHGASVGAAFALRSERNLERIRALLMLSVSTFGVMYAALVVIVLSGIGAGFSGQHWGRGWIWVSIVLLIVVVAGMAGMGTRLYTGARKAAGLPYREGNKLLPPVEPASPDEIYAAVQKGNPILLTVIGYGGFLIIAWLMIFKPF